MNARDQVRQPRPHLGMKWDAGEHHRSRIRLCHLTLSTCEDRSADFPDCDLVFVYRLDGRFLSLLPMLIRPMAACVNRVGASPGA